MKEGSMRRRRVPLFGVLATVGTILVFVLGAAAQLPPNVMLVRGTLDGAEPGTLVVKTKDGATRVGLTDKTGYAAVFKARLSDIKKGGYVGITAKRGPDGGRSEEHTSEL